MSLRCSSTSAATQASTSRWVIPLGTVKSAELLNSCSPLNPPPLETPGDLGDRLDLVRCCARIPRVSLWSLLAGCPLQRHQTPIRTCVWRGIATVGGCLCYIARTVEGDHVVRSVCSRGIECPIEIAALTSRSLWSRRAVHSWNSLYTLLSRRPGWSLHALNALWPLGAGRLRSVTRSARGHGWWMCSPCYQTRPRSNCLSLAPARFHNSAKESANSTMPALPKSRPHQ